MNNYKFVIVSLIFACSQLQGFADDRYCDASSRLAKIMCGWEAGSGAPRHRPGPQEQQPPEKVFLITGSGIVELPDKKMPETQLLLTTSIDQNGQTIYIWKTPEYLA